MQKRMKMKKYMYEVYVNDLTLIPLTNITKKDFTNYLQYAKKLKDKDDNKEENYHDDSYRIEEQNTTVTEMYRFTVNNTDLYLYKSTCKNGYYFI